MALTTVPVELANLDGAVTVNESSADVDFRIESNGLSHALFVDGGSDKVIINHTANVGQAGVAPMFQVHGTGSATSSISATRNSNDTGGPYLILSKSRGTSTGAVTVVQANDILGQIMFAGADGGDLAPVGASIQALVDGTPGTNDMPGRLLFSTTADGAEAATERMRIDSTGVLRLKAGTDTTGSSAEESFITHDNGGNTSLRIGSNYSNDNAAIRLQNNTTEIAVFKKTGVTMPLQPAFNAYASTAQNNLAVAGSGTLLIFGAERFDVGSNYDTSNGHFTAPVTGKYQLSVTTRIDGIDPASTYIYVTLTTSNSTYYVMYDHGGTDAAYFSYNFSVLADMDASDTAYVTFYQSGGSATADFVVAGANRFTGVLVA